MKVDKIQSYITPKSTGYASCIGLGLTVLSAKNKSLKKVHKPLGIITTILTLFHLGLIEFYHYKFRNK